MSVTTPLLTPMVDDLSAFGQDPWWLITIKAVLIFVVLVLLTLFNITAPAIAADRAKAISL